MGWLRGEDCTERTEGGRGGGEEEVGKQVQNELWKTTYTFLKKKKKNIVNGAVIQCDGWNMKSMRAFTEKNK